MDLTKETYRRFQAALDDLIEKNGGHGYITALAIDVGVSRARISQIKKIGTKKPANFELQVKIANVAGMSYEDFLLHGRTLLEGSPKDSAKLKKRPSTNREKPKKREVSSALELLAHVRHQTEYLDRIVKIMEEMRRDFKAKQDPLTGVGGESKKEGS